MTIYFSLGILPRLTLVGRELATTPRGGWRGAMCSLYLRPSPPRLFPKGSPLLLVNLFIWPKLLWPPLLTKALTVAKATLPKGILGRGGGPPRPKPPCPKAYLGGEAPRTCGSPCLGPWLEDLHRPPGPPSPPGSWGAAGRGGAGGGLTVVPIYAPPYPSPSFSRAGQVGTRLLTVSFSPGGGAGGRPSL